MSKAGEYNVKKVKYLVEQMEQLLAQNVRFPPKEADMIIRNLVQGLGNAVQTIEFMQDQNEFETRERMSIGVKSNAKH